MNSEILQMLNEINEVREIESKKLDAKVTRGEISSEKADLMRRANPEYYTTLKLPNFNFKVTDSVEDVLMMMTKKYEYLTNVKKATIKDVERLNAFELEEFKKKGELTNEILESYVDETPMSAIIDEVYRELDNKIINEENITFDNAEYVLDEIMNKYFVGRGSAIEKYSKEIKEERGSNWKEWINEDQRKELGLAFISKIYEITSNKNPIDLRNDFNKYKESKMNQKEDIDEEDLDENQSIGLATPDELENHVLVLEKKLLWQIATYRHEIIDSQIDDPKIEDIRAYKIAGKFGKNKVMIPFERYFSRYTDELKEGSYAKERYIQQARSIAKNTTMTTKQKINYMKQMFNVYKQMELDTRGERKPYVKPRVMDKYLPKPTKHFDEKAKYVLDLISAKREKYKEKRNSRRYKAD